MHILTRSSVVSSCGYSLCCVTSTLWMLPPEQGSPTPVLQSYHPETSTCILSPTDLNELNGFLAGLCRAEFSCISAIKLYMHPFISNPDESNDHHLMKHSWRCSVTCTNFRCISASEI
ncbi:hypothetical protein XENORESO_017702 [Xenotaenia resolanae]|uniref:Uncharacterized protein n=1 Tax=Xenotaenia resolanae TaxID=208358 RepID=A0ABV0WGL0_9TELE